MKHPLSPMTFHCFDLSGLFLLDPPNDFGLKMHTFSVIAICWIKFGIPNLNPRVLV